MPGFKDIPGQDHIKNHFKKAMENHRVSHAYILSGEAGTGRKVLADAFALTLMCEKGVSEPCLVCHSCRQVLSGNHPDLIYVSHEKTAIIGVNDIREQVNDTIMIRPYSSEYKIYIIEEAEKMTIQAQNALLKTIEEPPSYAVIILLTTNPDIFLPTILSRCIQLKLKPLKDSVIQEYLTNELLIPQIDAEIYSAFSRGNLGKAIQMAKSEKFHALHEQILHILKHIHNMDISMLLDGIKKIKEEDMDLLECLDFMEVWYRDILMFKVTNDANLLIFKEEYSIIKEISQKTGYDGFETIIQAIEKARVRLQANVNVELTMELMFLTIKEN